MAPAVIDRSPSGMPLNSFRPDTSGAEPADHTNIAQRNYYGRVLSVDPALPARWRPGGLFQILRVQFLKWFRNEEAILANELPVKVDRASAEIFSLNSHHIPVHLAAIAVIGLLVRLARCEVE